MLDLNLVDVSLVIVLCLLDDVLNVLLQLVAVVLKPDFYLVWGEVYSPGQELPLWR